MSRGPLVARRTPMAVALMMFGALPAGLRADDAASEPVQLDQVQVRGTRDSDYNAGRSSVGAKTDAALRDIPQTVNVVSRAVMDAQAATTLTDALRNVPGITLQAGEGGAIGDNVNLRGFTARTDIYLDGARDRGQFKRDTFELESVEVLKGPSSLFFGRGSTGGVINQVTKVPTLRSAYDLTGSIGSDGYYRSTVDLDRKIDDHAAVRLNAFVQDISSTRDVVENKDFGVAPSLRFGIGEATEVTLSGLVQRNHDIPDYGLPFLNGVPANVPRDRFYGDTDDFYRQEANVFRARLDQTLTSWLTLRDQFVASETNIAARPTPYRVCTAAIAAAAAPCPVAAANAPLAAITVQSDRRDREVDDDSIFNQLDLIAKFDTGSIGHQVIAGAEVGRDSTKNQGWTNTPRELDSLGNFTPGATPANTVRTRNATFTRGSGDTLGIYANETATLTKQLKLVAGLRWDQFDATSQTINNSDGSVTVTAGVPQGFQRRDYFTSVRGGLIWQPSDQQSYYVSYGTSFNPSAEAVTISAAQALVSPEKTESYETGGKWDVFNGGLSLSAAIFHIEKTNARTTDPTTALVTIDGNTQVDGGELGAVGRLTKNWQVIAGYTYLDSELVTAKDVSTTINGRVAVQGNALANTPRNSGSLWTSYTFLHDFETGAGVYYLGSRYVNTANVGRVDSYWRTDAMLAYHRPRYDLQLNLQNLFDVTYFDSIVASENGRAVPGRGRTIIGTAALHF